MSSIKFENALRNSHAYSLVKKDIPLEIGHAYMVISPDEEVVDNFFKLVACSIFCKDNSACLTCPECLKVLHNNHEDIIDIYPERKSINSEQIKDFLDTIYIKSYSDRKLYFIHRADSISQQMQNKLLKTLEEPPMGVTIFLGVSNESSMLDTIKSRSRIINMDLFSTETIIKELIALGCEEDVLASSAICSEGSLGKAYQIAQSTDYSEMFSTAFELLEGLNRSSDIVRLSKLVSSQKDMCKFFDILSIIIRDIMMSKENEDLVQSKYELDRITTISNKFSAKALAEILRRINEERRKLSILPQWSIGGSVTDDLLFFILEAKHKWQ